MAALRYYYDSERRSWASCGPDTRLCGAGARVVLGIDRSKKCCAFDLVIRSEKFWGSRHVGLVHTNRGMGTFLRLQTLDNDRIYNPTLGLGALEWVERHVDDSESFWIGIRNRAYERKT